MTLGSDQDQMSAPITAERANHHPEEFVAGTQPRSLPGRPCQHRELMTEQEILGDQCLTVTYGRTEKAEQKKEILEHRPNIMPLRARNRPGRLLHPYSRHIRGQDIPDLAQQRRTERRRRGRHDTALPERLPRSGALSWDHAHLPSERRTTD
jgi:hypothetical protein